MLVLSRKINESIVVNDNISIVVVEIHGDKVRLGIDAPKDVTVHRKEIYEAIQQQAGGQGSVKSISSGKKPVHRKTRSASASRSKRVPANSGTDLTKIVTCSEETPLKTN
ncbi:MAG: carbon storage regulator CsrA [Thermoguttaceae bacterium]|nr:carbon storage regulator CsrA [Thermoguttaceae bacterium]